MNIVVNSSIYSQPMGWDMGFHAHAGFEISVLLEGRGQFEWANQYYDIETGHVILIPEHVSHSYRSSSSVRFAVLDIQMMTNKTQTLLKKMMNHDQPSLVYLSPLALEQYEQLFRQWLRMISAPMVEAEQCLDTWVHLLTLFILQHQTSLPTGVTVVSSADYIKNSLHSPISISELAKRCGLSESAFRTSFKKTFGVSPKLYQQTCRLSEAKWLLRSTDRPIQQIAQRIGFTGIHAFSAWFQKLEAISPKDWRKSQQSI